MEPHFNAMNEPGRRHDSDEDVSVVFTGAWTTEEQQYIRDSVRSLIDDSGQPQEWRCGCIRIEGAYLYQAARPSDENDLEARTVESLARKMWDRVLPS